MRAVVLMFTMVFLVSCQNESCREAISPVKVSLKTHRLEQELFKSESEADVIAFLDQNDRLAKVFLHAEEYPSNEILGKKLFQLIKNPSIDTLYTEANEAFENFGLLKSEIEEGLGRLKALYPETPSPELMTIVTGFYNDLLITHKEVIIGMDFFIGEGATYKPQEIPDYILRRYNREHLPSIILKFISSQYVKPSEGETMLAEMIDHGKSLYLTSYLLPCTPENIIMGYTEDEWRDVFENDQIIWANFVTNKWLFETSHFMKQKFIGERPNVYEIGEKCPGRIGQWLGWQIINDYVSETGISITELMAETDANKIFNQSGYKPG